MGDFLTLLVTERDCSSAADAPGPPDAAGALPVSQTIDGFNFTYQSSLRFHMLGSALTPDFVTEGRSLVLTGNPDAGKRT
ncbi:MAG: hypothetical protein ACRD2X_14095 [Vicinamibacteraceae bacterium]